MIQLTVLYGQPQDPAAFDRYYHETHVSLAKRLPGLKGYTVNKPTSLDPQERSPYYLIADLYFENTGHCRRHCNRPKVRLPLEICRILRPAASPSWQVRYRCTIRFQSAKAYQSLAPL
jgi:uncharacterized protein (TIGR02118 family)